MLRWLRDFFERPQRVPAPPAPALEARDGARVTFDDRLITVHQSDAREQTIAWSDLGAVTLITTGGIGDEAELFWQLTDREDHRRALLPMGALGEHDLLKAMQSRLHGFDNMAVVEAMSNATDASFLVWEYGRREVGNPV